MADYPQQSGDLYPRASILLQSELLFASNWELSMARAVSVVDYLTDLKNSDANGFLFFVIFFGNFYNKNRLFGTVQHFPGRTPDANFIDQAVSLGTHDDDIRRAFFG